MSLLPANDALFNAICRLALVSTNGRPPYQKHNMYDDDKGMWMKMIRVGIKQPCHDLLKLDPQLVTNDDNNDHNDDYKVGQWSQR